MDRATPSAMLPGVDAPAPGPSTTHFSVIDAKGNMVAATITLNFFFGSGLMIPGTGILLNNQMDDFSAKPGVPNGFQLIGADANAIAAEEAAAVLVHANLRAGARWSDDHRLTGRQLHPGHGDPGYAGLPGRQERAGSRERAALPPPVFARRAAASRPMRSTPEERKELEARGHTLREGTRRWGNVQVVIWNYKTGKVEAASDPRGAGVGLVY